MQLTGEQIIPGTLERVWESINDMAVVRRCIPGCEGIEPIGGDRHEVALIAAIGPVKARFRGNISMRDVTPPHSYVMEFEGNGGVAGFARGRAQVWLEAIGDSQTRLRHEVQAEIGGKLAQVGSRLVDAAAGKLSSQFFEALTREVSKHELTGGAPSAPAASSAGQSAPQASLGLHAPAVGWPDRVRVEIALLGGGWIAAALAAGAFAGLLIGISLGR